MKRVFLLLLINTTILSVAAAPDKELVVMASDATSSSALKSIRRITFNQGMMLVDMKDGSSMSWDTDWVNCVVFGDCEPGEETTVAGVANSVAFSVKDGMLHVNSCSSAAVQLCCCDGKVVYDGLCAGELSLDLNSLPAGVYVLKLDGCTYKILNR